MFGKKEKLSEIELLVDSELTEDRYILDDENAIVVIKNNDRHTHCQEYIMIHRRLQEGKLIEMNRWYINTYYFGAIERIAPIKELNLFRMHNGSGAFDALYDYKKGEYVIPRGVWKEIMAGRNNEILNEYNGFLAYFEILSDYEKGDVFAYNTPITNERIVQSFCVKDDNYYAIINTDGTIRGNKLFKGSSFSKISEIIDLNQYESMDAFKQERKKICNDLRDAQKQAYQQMIKDRNDGNVSPYLDNEVAKVLGVSK